MAIRDKQRRRSFLAGLAGLVTAASPFSWLTAGDRTLVRRGVRRVSPVCSLPAADYQHGGRSPSVVMRSQLAIPIVQPGNIEQAIAAIRGLAREANDVVVPSLPPPVVRLEEAVEVPAEFLKRQQAHSAIASVTAPRAKLLLMPQREMAMMHCQISDIALWIEPTGIWHLSLRADQNPRFRDETTRELQMKRNAFRINIRLLRSAQTAAEPLAPADLPPPAIDQAGKIALAHIIIEEFWVEREAPFYLTRRNFDPMIATYFDAIDQAEFEFFIRLDPLTGNGRGVVQPWQRIP